MTRLQDSLSRVATCSLLVASAVVLAACPTSTSTTPEPDATAAMGLDDILPQLFDDVVATAASDFVDEADALDAAVTAWAADVTAGNDTTVSQASAQAAFVSATLSWQRLEVMQLGPLALPTTTTVQAEGLRDEVYSWPVTSPCEVDRNVASEDFVDADFVELKRVNVYGLDALEYLLHVDTVDNACPAPASLNTSGDWDALSDDDITTRRARYAEVVADTLRQQAASVVDKLDAYRVHFVEAGQDGSDYATQADALQALLDALFYLEFDAKDQKLGVVVGVHADCATDTCADDVEHPFAEASLRSIAANLDGFAAVFNGGDDDTVNAGIAAALTNIGEEQLRDDVRSAIADARAHFAQHESTVLRTLVADDLDEARALHASLKAVTDLLKGDLIAALTLSVPEEGGGDAD